VVVASSDDRRATRRQIVQAAQPGTEQDPQEGSGEDSLEKPVEPAHPPMYDSLSSSVIIYRHEVRTMITGATRSCREVSCHAGGMEIDITPRPDPMSAYNSLEAQSTTAMLFLHSITASPAVSASIARA